MTYHSTNSRPRKASFVRKLLSISLPAFLITLVALEVLLRSWIVAAESPPITYDQEHHLLKLDTTGQRTGMFSMGPFAQKAAYWHVNNHGWNHARDYTFDKRSGLPRACLIGDSYIEAKHVHVQHSLGTRLNEDQHKYEVYSFGISGAPLSQYLHMSRYVVQHYDPDLLIFNLLHHDFAESLLQYKRTPHFLQLDWHGSAMREIPPSPPERMTRWLRHSALMRYLFFNLNLSATYQELITREKQIFNANIPVAEVEQIAAELRAGTDYLISTIASENKDRRVLFVLDGPRRDIYQDQLEESSVQWIHTMTAEICQKHGVDLLDLTETFDQRFRADGRPFNSRYDYHWDEYGHEVVAERLAAYLRRR